MKEANPDSRFIARFVDAVTTKPLLEGLRTMRRARREQLLQLRDRWERDAA